MKKMSSDMLKWIRNVAIFLTIICGFGIWTLIPSSFKNTPFIHVGNGEYGCKTGILLLLLLPFLPFIGRLEEQEFHSETAREEARRKRLESETVSVLGICALVIGNMLFAAVTL